MFSSFFFTFFFAQPFLFSLSPSLPFLPPSLPPNQGALGRFVNHSCEPNCETQKWLVRGELAIGLFALRDIKAGEELTFDYNFDRYGDKPMRCLCATPSCCGYIGGGGIDGEEGRVAEEDLSDYDEALDATHDPEPIMVDAGHGTGSSKGVDPALLSVMEAQVGLAPGETPLGSRKKKAAPEKPKGADSDDEDFDEDRELGKKKKPTDEEMKRKGGGGGGRRRNTTEEDDYDSDDDVPPPHARAADGVPRWVDVGARARDNRHRCGRCVARAVLPKGRVSVRAAVLTHSPIGAHAQRLLWRSGSIASHSERTQNWHTKLSHAVISYVHVHAEHTRSKAAGERSR